MTLCETPVFHFEEVSLLVLVLFLTRVHTMDMFCCTNTLKSTCELLQHNT